MNLEQAKKLIPLYLSDELQDKQLQQFKDFLASSPECQKELDAYQKTWDVLGEIEDIQPRADYISRFWTKLATRESWGSTLLQNARALLGSRKFVPVLATACIIIIVSLSVLRNTTVPESPLQNLSQISDEDWEFVENLELVESLEIIEDLELLEDLEVLEEVEGFKVSKA